MPDQTDFSEAYEFAQKSEPGFNIFVPGDLNRFIDEFRLKFKHSQFLVCKGKEIVFVKVGELSSVEFGQILKMIRSMK